MRRSLLIVSIGLVASAGVAQPETDPLLRLASTEPLELARAVDRLGDQGVLLRLEDEAPVEVRAVAVLAAPYMHAPENALPALVVIAAGRDPDLSARAAHSVLAIARGLDPQGIDARECDRAALGPARAGLAALARDVTARPDIVRAAELSLAALVELGVPPA